MRTPSIARTALAVALCVLPVHVAAQVRLGDFCQTEKTMCTTSLATVGAACRCPPQNRSESWKMGKVIVRPPNVSNTCSTRLGVCRVEYGMTGSACMCGANDPGRRLPLTK